MNITIEDVEETIKKVFGDSDILNTESVYESIDGEDNKQKLVIFFNKVFGNHDSILYTKLIFIVDIDKINLVDNTFLYLYDIDCQYNNKQFEDLEELEDELSSIVKKSKFGPSIKILSKFIETPTFLINDWLKEHKVSEFSVSTIKYVPKVHIIPCKSLSLPFEIEINGVVIGLIITKNEKFNYTFNINNEYITILQNTLSNLVETIGNTLKNNFK